MTVAIVACPVCGIPLERRREPCPSPACPCYGTVAGSPEMESAALRWRSRGSVAQSRTWQGDDALDALERAELLDYQAAAGALIDVQIEHEARP